VSIIRSPMCWCLARLHQHLVDERRLAMIDVGDDGDVAQILARRGHGWLVSIVVRGVAWFSRAAPQQKQSIIPRKAQATPQIFCKIRDLGYNAVSGGRSGHRPQEAGMTPPKWVNFPHRPHAMSSALPGPETANAVGRNRSDS